jgi:hypothetical protein
MKKSLICLSLLISLGACGPLQNLEDTTKSTKDLNKKTDEVLKEINESNYNIAKTHRDLREGDSFAARTEALDILLEADTLSKKLVAGNVYVNAFEFQFLNAKDLSNREYVDEHYAQAISELAKEVNSHLKDKKPYLSITGDKITAEMISYDASLAAIGVNLHRLRLELLEEAEKAGITTEPINLLKLIKTSLKKKYNSYEDLSHAEAAVITERNSMRLLLQARVNLLSMSILKTMASMNTLLSGESVEIAKSIKSNIDALLPADYAKLVNTINMLKKDIEEISPEDLNLNNNFICLTRSCEAKLVAPLLLAKLEIPSDKENKKYSTKVSVLNKLLAEYSASIKIHTDNKQIEQKEIEVKDKK